MQSIADWNKEKLLIHGKAQQRSSIARMRNKTFVSKVVLAYAANISKEDGLLGETLPVDQECYNFAIDTCTTYHICKHKELFVGEI